MQTLLQDHDFWDISKNKYMQPADYNNTEI